MRRRVPSLTVSSSIFLPAAPCEVSYCDVWQNGKADNLLVTRAFHIPMFQEFLIRHLLLTPSVRQDAIWRDLFVKEFLKVELAYI